MKLSGNKKLIGTLCMLIPVVITAISDYTSRVEEQKQSEEIESLKERISALEQQ